MALHKQGVEKPGHPARTSHGWWLISPQMSAPDLLALRQPGTSPQPNKPAINQGKPHQMLYHLFDSPDRDSVDRWRGWPQYLFVKFVQMNRLTAALGAAGPKISWCGVILYTSSFFYVVCVLLWGPCRRAFFIYSVHCPWWKSG